MTSAIQSARTRLYVLFTPDNALLQVSQLATEVVSHGSGANPLPLAVAQECVEMVTTRETVYRTLQLSDLHVELLTTREIPYRTLQVAQFCIELLMPEKGGLKARAYAEASAWAELTVAVLPPPPPPPPPPEECVVCVPVYFTAVVPKPKKFGSGYTLTRTEKNEN